LNEAIDGLTTVLTREQMQRLEEPYIPHAPLGQE
jgi:hypothetical protein